jgi:hypothetical protein
VAVVAGTAAEAADTPWAAFPAAVSAGHTALELPEQAGLHTALAAVQETETLQLRDSPSPESVGIGVAVAGTQLAVAVDSRSVEGSGRAAGILVVGPGAVVPSSCCTFWGQHKSYSSNGGGLWSELGRSVSGQDDTPLLSKLHAVQHRLREITILAMDFRSWLLGRQLEFWYLLSSRMV